MDFTIYDVAKKAGVSIATVSRVLNGTGKVSAKTRAKIELVLKESNYQPNQMARGLARKSSMTVGIVTVDIRDTHHAAVTYEIEHALMMQNYSSIVCNLGGRWEETEAYLEMLLSRQVAGIIFVGSVFMDQIPQRLLEQKLGRIPLVLVNGWLEAPNTYGILHEEYQGFADAVEYLVKEKHRKNLALITLGGNHSEGQKQRGFEYGMDLCLPEAEKIVLYSVKTPLAAAQATNKLMEKYPRVDGILYSEDLLAVGGLNFLLDMGHQIPDDISIIGANNSIFATLTRPPLTSINYRLKESGQLAAQILIDLFAGKKVEKNHSIPCALIKRESTEKECFQEC